MNRFIPYSSILLFASFCFFQNIDAKNNPEKKENPGFFFSMSPWHMCSLDFIKYMLKEKTGLCCTALGAVIGYNLYQDEIANLKKEIKNHHHSVALGSLITLTTLYAFKNSLKKYLTATEENEENSQANENELCSSDEEKMLKSRISVFMPGQITTTFDDIAGLQNAKEELWDILNYLKNPEIYQKIGAKMPKGILFSGDPGNGKTLLARAVAGMTNCPFIVVHASAFVEMFVGVGAARIRHLFKIAQSIAPCIIFIDELDAIGSKRADTTNNEYKQTLNELLAALDGFSQTKSPVIIIAATNRPEELDEALTRPGRFDKKITINKPSFQDRIELIKKILEKIQHDENIDITAIAKSTRHFSCAEITNLLNEAALLAIRDYQDQVSMHHIDQARDIFLMGHETLGMEQSKEDQYRTAVHETGHALAHVLIPDAMPLYKVSITPRDGILGVTHGLPEKEIYNLTKAELEANIMIALAGLTAEEIIFGYSDTGAHSDLQAARQYATAIVMRHGMGTEFPHITFAQFINQEFNLPDSIATKLHHEIANIITSCKQKTKDLLEKNQSFIKQIASELLTEKTLSGEYIYNVCNIDKPNITFSLS